MPQGSFTLQGLKVKTLGNCASQHPAKGTRPTKCSTLSPTLKQVPNLVLKSSG